MPYPFAGSLAGKVVVVTGAASGIGAAVAAAGAESGARVIGVDTRAHPLVSVVGDITDRATVDQLTSHVAGGPGRVDYFVSNAGIDPRAALGDLDHALWSRVMDVNVWAGVEILRALLPYLGPGASVVTVSSIRARLGFTGDAAYHASKGAIESLTRALAVELAPLEIRVNAVAPGAIRTSMNAASLDMPEVAGRLADRIPQRRVGQPEEVAAAILFLASDAASYITGTVLPVDGGYLIQG
ncbi:SDR family oxidoreductase [Phytohabitans sp. ZYX-F-186]|uniref:SDR family oxidoreductase n=1 Tax=Phytohabitans maris TaxID=3071409 RepID=A0ABU0ZSZ1_9ACTN|nr:SDR family oxidoreductase [Phytohabitans sp. ZYX-F-186]MDQ7910090.1 SDR family oxidoreductase [Phytohabitans sp. ZYX-F-186]